MRIPEAHACGEGVGPWNLTQAEGPIPPVCGEQTIAHYSVSLRETLEKAEHLPRNPP